MSSKDAAVHAGGVVVDGNEGRGRAEGEEYAAVGQGSGGGLGHRAGGKGGKEEGRKGGRDAELNVLRRTELI